MSMHPAVASRHDFPALISGCPNVSRMGTTCLAPADGRRLLTPESLSISLPAHPSRSGTRSSRVIRAESSGPSTTYTAPPPAVPSDKQKTDVRVVRLTDDTWAIRGRCEDRLKFEVEYGLKVGTTENSYVVQGGPDGELALIDLPDQSFSNAFVGALGGSMLDLGSLKYLVLGHLSPKRVDSLIALIEARKKSAGSPPPLKVLCSNPAYQTLLAALDLELLAPSLEVQVVRGDGGTELDLGGGHVLRFILTPTPRWPDSMATYDPATQLLYTNKLFSAHVALDSDFDIGGLDVYGEHWKFFFDCMIAPVAKQANVALDRLPITAQFTPPSYSGKTGIDVVKADLGFIWSAVLSTLNFDLNRAASLSPSSASSSELVTGAICPLHGPIVRSSLTELVRQYKEWTAERIKQAEEATIAVIFASAYGNTSALAQAISRGILRSGIGVETYNCEVSSAAEVAAAVARSKGFVIGAPTLGGHMPTPVQECLGVILKDSSARAKPCGVFGSFGWSGEAVDELEQRLRDGGFGFAFPAIRCKFKPTESMLQVCEESGRDLARSVKKAAAKQSKEEEGLQQSAASTVEQAVGRVVGSLCVLSAKKGDAESAMLASWVSQASFNPPGITIAVAKERAVESIVLPGDTFVLNVLGEGSAGKVTKQLLKAFKPGEPRFGDLATKPSECGATILTDAIAYVQCTVTSRMEAGDHWVLYGTVDQGKLLDDKSLTALHHRKTGAKY